jgi:hypothetical protein
MKDKQLSRSNFTKMFEKITTVAGTGAFVCSGDGGQAKLAILYNPKGITVDASGNIYIADDIRKVTKSTGTITDVAGTGYYVYSGDGGQATSAGFYPPLGVTVDASGYIYIADSFNDRICMVTKSTGIVTDVAGTGKNNYSEDGGQATSATLSDPLSVAIDASGKIYITDSYNYRKICMTPSLQPSCIYFFPVGVPTLSPSNPVGAPTPSPSSPVGAPTPSPSSPVGVPTPSSPSAALLTSACAGTLLKLMLEL